MDTAQENQMETTNIHHNPDQSALYENVRLSFTPSFFSHGWEYSLSPIHEFSNTYLDASGDLKLILEDIHHLIQFMVIQKKNFQFISAFGTAFINLFL